MNANNAVKGRDHLKGTRLARVDELCDQFATAWRRGERPCLADFADHVDSADRPVAIRELIGVEIEYRVRCGEIPTADEYALADPELDRSWVEQAIATELVISGADSSALGSSVPDHDGLEPPWPDQTHGPGCIGHYRLLELIGRGSNGAVWKARDEKLDRLVALKIPHIHRATPYLLARVSREARVVARLRHPGIVTLHEVIQFEGRPVLVSDYVHGTPLDEVLERRRLSPRETAGAVARLAETLHYVHERGAVHRDIKPANVLIPRRGSEADPVDDLESPLILDFGLAFLVGCSAALTQEGDFLGTPAYMSPEQASGRLREIDGQSDLYSLGIVLYQMLTGAPPFRGPHPVLVSRIVRDSPRRPRSIKPTIPRDLESICLKAIAKERRERYGSAREMADDLVRFLRGEPIRASSAGAARRLVYWARRRPAVAALMVTVSVSLVAVVAAVTGWLYSGRLQAALVAADVARQAEARQRRESEFSLYLNRIGLASREWLAGNVGHCERVLEECPPELRSWEWRHLKSLCHRDILTIGHQGDGERSSSVVTVAYSPDGRRLASADREGDVRIWDADTGRELRRLEGHDAPVRALAFRPDGRIIATVSNDDTLRLWDHETGTQEKVIRTGRHFPASVAYSPDGALLATGSGYEVDEYGPEEPHHGTVKLWDAATGLEVGSLVGHTQHVLSIAFRADGRQLASASGAWMTHDAFERGDGEVMLWDLPSGVPVRVLSGHKGAVTGVAYSSDGTRLASTGADRTVRIWDLATARPIATAMGHRDWISGLVYGPGGDWVATSSRDGTVRIWDTATGHERSVLRGHTDSVACVAVRPDGARLASGGSDRTIKVWDPARPQAARVLADHKGPVACVKFLPDGRRLVTASNPVGDDDSVHAQIWLWDAVTGTRLGEFSCPTGLVFEIAISPTGRWLAAGIDHHIKLWEIDTGREVRTLSAVPEVTSPRSSLRNSVRGLAFSPDETRLVSASQRPQPDGQDHTRARRRQVISEWDLATGRETHALVGKFPISRNLTISPLGDMLAFARDSYNVSLVATDWSGPPRTFLAHDRVVSCLAFSSDGALLATGSWDQTAKVWNPRALDASASITPALILRGHMGVISSVAFSPDGGRLATASADHTVRLWDARTGQEIVALTGPAGPVNQVAFSPDGNRLAAASSDGTARVWEAPGD